MQKKKVSKTNDDEKGRNFTFIVYPESAPPDWKEQLEQTFCRIAISPLHDKDVEPGTQTLKKPHFHVILMYANTTTVRHITKITESVRATRPQIVMDMKGMFNYLTHKNHLEKYQYDEEEITYLNDFDPRNIKGAKSFAQELDDEKKIIELIRYTGVATYKELCDYLYDNDEDYLLAYARKNVSFLRAYLQSKRPREDKAMLDTVMILRDEIKDLKKLMEKRGIALEEAEEVNPLGLS